MYRHDRRETRPLLKILGINTFGMQATPRCSELNELLAVLVLNERTAGKAYRGIRSLPAGMGIPQVVFNTTSRTTIVS